MIKIVNCKIETYRQNLTMRFVILSVLQIYDNVKA